jgi:trans-aconitate methyltransferase
MEIADYYNKIQRKFLIDYIDGNPRLVAGIAEMLRRLPKQANRILDIGCGIGWSSYAIAANFLDKTIHGIDLSTESVKIANRLFSHPNIKFNQIDVTEDNFHCLGEFDFIVMLDVLEHIPKHERMKFSTSLSKVLSRDGSIFLTCPTILHQNHLRENNPNGLQPVDEDISYGDVAEISEIVGGQVTYFEYKDIWHTNDYFHCLIQKNPSYKIREAGPSNFELENRSQRIERALNSGLAESYDLRSIQNTSDYNGNKRIRYLRRKIKSIIGL